MLLYGVSFIQQLVMAVCTRKNAHNKTHSFGEVVRLHVSVSVCMGTALDFNPRLSKAIEFTTLRYPNKIPLTTSP